MIFVHVICLWSKSKLMRLKVKKNVPTMLIRVTTMHKQNLVVKRLVHQTICTLVQDFRIMKTSNFEEENDHA